MEYGIPPEYIPPPIDLYITGGVPNRLPYHPAQEDQAAPVAAPSHKYPVDRSASITKRKKYRAQQACNNCRQKKQKCDGARPCDYCTQQQLDCEYKEVQPLKTDRATATLLDKQQQTTDSVEKVHTLLSQILQEIGRLSEQVSSGGDVSGPATTRHDIDSLPPQTQHDVDVAKLEEHNTGAHHLVIEWTDIKKFFEQAGVRDKEYVYEEEEKRSILDPFDSFQSSSYITFPPDFSHRSPSIGFTGDVPSSGSASDGGSWSSRFGMSNITDISSHGGLGPDGKLKLEEETVRRLYDSYFNHMWIMHPFIDARELKRMLETFITVYSSISVSPLSFPYVSDVQDSYTGIPSKRKRHKMAGDDRNTPSSPDGRAVEHAIVLLILALGKILEHDNFLLEDPSTAPTRTSMSAGFAMSHTPSAVPMSGVSSPERRDPERRSQCRNLEGIPGLAYFIPASIILGMQHAGNDMQHAQAYLLAGLYMGQLGRVLSSWSYIYTASRTIVVLLQKRCYNDLKLKDKGKPPPMCGILTTVSTLYWSALQLESDIRAELDKLPPSLIWGYEDSLRTPERTLGTVGNIGNEYVKLHSGDLSVRDVMFHYQAHISIRKILNRAHAALYSVEDQAKKVSRENFKATWADADAPELWKQLTGWRKILPPNLQWQDSDDPAAEINTARLRGKYYGAAYIITRPYLCYAIHQMRKIDEETLQKIMLKVKQNSPTPNTDQRLPPLSPLYFSDRENTEHIIWVCIQCIDAAIKSTKAFDGLSPGHGRISKRPRVTNIHGTAAAQFSNMLVLSATYKSWLRDLIDYQTFWDLMNRTIALLGRLAPLSPVFQINKGVLEKAAKELQLHDEQFSATPNTQPG